MALWFYLFNLGSIETVKNCQCQLYFKLSWQCTGNCFQLARILSQINLFGYDTATSQIWLCTFKRFLYFGEHWNIYRSYALK